MRLIIGITGGSGVIYGLKILEVLEEKNIKTDLVISPAAEKIIDFEIEKNVSELKDIATRSYDYKNLGAPISSGSVNTNGMIIAPCSMKTVGSLASGVTDNLITRAADVTIKEDRKLVIVPRETPIHSIHLDNMSRLSKSGITILPACPGFYHQPESVEELVNFVVGKTLDQFEIDHELYKSWEGL